MFDAKRSALSRLNGVQRATFQRSPVSPVNRSSIIGHQSHVEGSSNGLPGSIFDTKPWLLVVQIALGTPRPVVPDVAFRTYQTELRLEDGSYLSTRRAAELQPMARLGRRFVSFGPRTHPSPVYT